MKTLSPSDPFWDELGVTWAAVHPEIAVIMPRLKARIHRQSILITAGLILGLPAVLAALLVGVYCIWIGGKTGAWNFVLRGASFVAGAAIVSLAMSSLLHVRVGDGLRSLSEMLDFAIARSRKTLLVIRLGYCACGVTALLGVVGSAIRAHLSRPPALSPIIDLALLAIFALGLFLYGRRIQSDLRKYTQLRRAVIPEEES